MTGRERVSFTEEREKKLGEKEERERKNRKSCNMLEQINNSFPSDQAACTQK